VAVLFAALVGLAGCGGKETVGNRIPGRTLTIYSSAPMHGASWVSSAAVVSGEKLALAQEGGRLGKYRIVLKTLDDSTAARDGWDPGQTTLNARQAVLDKTTIGYIGELNSGASAISIPLLNRVGIPQISPSSTAVGLTTADAGAAPGEPEKYYPTGIRTFARVVANDSVQAAAQVKLQKSLGCDRTYVLDDGEFDGADMAGSFVVAAQTMGLRVVNVQPFPERASDYSSLATSVAQSGADCVLISALTESGAVLLTKQLAAAAPHMQIFGSAGLAESTYTDPSEGGIPVSLDSRVLITVAALGPAAYPATSRAFFADYGARAGLLEPYAIYGYEAMSLMLSSISRATDRGRETARRSEVREALFSTHDRHSVLGTYSIDHNGDTTLRRYGVYRIVGGELVYVESIEG
jgi:branched-chain amino acid transport system substrate-binding protein